jgi:hypothetical protein
VSAIGPRASGLISTESGNPWGEFIRRSEDRCGREPTGFEVLSASIALDQGGSSSVSGLDDVISGQATVFVASTRGSDADALRVDVATAVHVGLRATTDRDKDDSFSMDVIVTFQARAHC